MELSQHHYRPVTHLRRDDQFYRDPGYNYAPAFTIPLATQFQPVPTGSGSENFALRQQYEAIINKHIQSMPTRVIRTSDMTLVNRTDVFNELRSYIEYIGNVNEIYWRLAGFAVLSHRWGAEEVTFQEMRDSPDHDELRKKHGFHKLKKFCEIARMHGCDWAWADTCCIDKTSSAELDEAIRSMYRWYKDAAICIVHLADTACLGELAGDAWFTRGWTLQELLAPKRIKFFTKDWLPLGSDENDKEEWTPVMLLVSDITTIPMPDIHNFTVGTDRIREKMCWAAKRTTTRIEDVAYSLIGIFGVSMGIMYGEGSRAFDRLQLAIAEQTNTTELFFWQGPHSDFNGMLAQAPESFVVPVADKIQVDLTTAELQQFTPRDIWCLIATMIKEDFRFCRHCSKYKRKARKLGGKRRRRKNARIMEHEQRIIRGILRTPLERVEAETVLRIGPGILQRVDGETLRRLGTVLLEKHPELDDSDVLDDDTRYRLQCRLDLDWTRIPWGGQHYMMTGAGFALDVFLCDVQMRPWNGINPNDPFTVYASIASSQDTVGGYVVASTDCFSEIPNDLKLAVLDYYWGDTFHDHNQLHSALQKSPLRDTFDLSAIRAEIETRLYHGVFLKPDVRGKDCFQRVFTNGVNVTLIRRPEGGWDQPQQVYIK